MQSKLPLTTNLVLEHGMVVRAVEKATNALANLGLGESNGNLVLANLERIVTFLQLLVDVVSLVDGRRHNGCECIH
jgi:hypothetical protein